MANSSWLAALLTLLSAVFCASYYSPVAVVRASSSTSRAVSPAIAGVTAAPEMQSDPMTSGISRTTARRGQLWRLGSVSTILTPLDVEEYHERRLQFDHVGVMLSAALLDSHADASRRIGTHFRGGE